MKTTRILGATLLATSVFLGACGDDDDDEPTGNNGPTATVRFVNTSGQAIDVGLNGTFAAGNSDLAFGEGSSCMAISPSTGTLSFRQNGQTSTFTPAGFNLSGIQAGKTYTVVLSGAPGAYTAQTFEDTYTGASASQGGVRVINATGTTYGLYVGPSGTRPTTATNATFASGTASAFVPVNTGQGQVWFTTGTGNNITNAFTSSAFTVSGNAYQTLVVAPAATTGGDLRSFAVNSCQQQQA
jgi:hypothetical protein